MQKYKPLFMCTTAWTNSDSIYNNLQLISLGALHRRYSYIQLVQNKFNFAVSVVLLMLFSISFTAFYTDITKPIFYIFWKNVHLFSGTLLYQISTSLQWYFYLYFFSKVSLLCILASHCQSSKTPNLHLDSFLSMSISFH